MPRPTTKSELTTAADAQWTTLWSLVDGLPDPSAVVFDFGAPTLKEAHWRRDQNLRDVLVHLHEWHRLLLEWVTANVAGERRPFLPEPYTWASYGALNERFRDQHQGTTVDDAAALVRASHAEVIALVESFTEEELFARKHFPWTGTTNLASYCISATSSHYAWAAKKLRAYRKTV